MPFELVISTPNDASSGLYETRQQVHDAVNEAASVDNLVARYCRSRDSGYLIDADGKAWFEFVIRVVREEGM